MSVAAISEARAASRPPRSFCSFFRQAEDLGVTLVLSAMVLLLILSALLFMGCLNQVLQRLGAMLPDEGLRLEIKQITTLNAQRETLFKGETLRSMLLNAYGWWTIGVYTTYAAFALMIVALGVLGALVFEVFVAARRPERIKVAQKIAA